MSEPNEGDTFEDKYPSLADWVINRGRIEIGEEGFLPSFIRVLDEGGLVWEGNTHYPSIDAALADAEAGVKEWIGENG